MVAGRERALAMLRAHLGPTEVGREFGINRLETLEDLRESVPLMDAKEHQVRVEQRLGFGVVDPDDPTAHELAGSSCEREAVVAVWRHWLGAAAPQQIALLRGHSIDPILDRILTQDLEALGGKLLRIVRADDPAAVLEELERFDPDVLVVPSALTCGWLERVHRVPLERRLPSLRIVLVEHDIHRRVRTRLPFQSAGWIHRSGRMGLPTQRSPTGALALAVGTQIIELLPWSHRDGVQRTILPEQAVLGQHYELVVSSAIGFLRLRTDLHVRVVGFDPPTLQAQVPRPRMIRLAGMPVDIPLEGCTLPGAWLTASVRQAFRPEDPALVAAEIAPDPESFAPGAMTSTATMRLPEAFAETELGWLSRTGVHTPVARPRALLVRVELQDHVARQLPGRVSDHIDRDLRRRSPAYAYLRKRGDLDAPRVMVLSHGTYRAEEERRLRSLLGPVWLPEVRVVA